MTPTVLPMRGRLHFCPLRCCCFYSCRNCCLCLKILCHCAFLRHPPCYCLLQGGQLIWMAINWIESHFENAIVFDAFLVPEQWRNAAFYLFIYFWWIMRSWSLSTYTIQTVVIVVATRTTNLLGIASLRSLFASLLWNYTVTT